MAAPALSMPLFVNPADVILRMQLSEELQGLSDVVESGIIGAQLHVERILGSKLGRRTHDCQYFLDLDAYSGVQPGGVFRLELPSGFIRTDTPVQVSVTDEPKIFSPYTAIDASLMMVDYGRGYVLVDASEYNGVYARVQCDTGYEDGSSLLPVDGLPEFDPNREYFSGQRVQYVGKAYENLKGSVQAYPVDTTNWKLLYSPREALPTEITEAILSMVPVVFDASQTTNRNQEAENQYKKSTDHAILVMQPFLRMKGFAFRPLV